MIDFKLGYELPTRHKLFYGRHYTTDADRYMSHVQGLRTGFIRLVVTYTKLVNKFLDRLGL